MTYAKLLWGNEILSYWGATTYGRFITVGGAPLPPATVHGGPCPVRWSVPCRWSFGDECSSASRSEKGVHPQGNRPDTAACNWSCPVILSVIHFQGVKVFRITTEVRRVGVVKTVFAENVARGK